MKIDCQKINQEIGVYCHPINDETLLVSTPLYFSDNSAINVYIKSCGDLHIVTDDGNTMMRFYGLGMGNNSRLATSINKRAEDHKGSLVDGCLVFSAPSIREAYSNFLKTMTDIINYEEEHAAISESKASVINDIVTELERRNPGCQVQRNVSLVGYTGRRYIFPLKADDRVIALTFAHHQSTGSMLRKIADLVKNNNEPPLIVIDDSGSEDQGEREAALIGNYFSCMLMSNLKSEDAPLNLKYH